MRENIFEKNTRGKQKKSKEKISEYTSLKKKNSKLKTNLYLMIRFLQYLCNILLCTTWGNGCVSVEECLISTDKHQIKNP